LAVTPKFKNGDVVRIDWSKVGRNDGNFGRWPPIEPLRVMYAIGPRLGSLQSYLVKDKRGLTDVVSEEVITLGASPASETPAHVPESNQ
jgi:hypothetical protein